MDVKQLNYWLVYKPTRLRLEISPGSRIRYCSPGQRRSWYDKPNTQWEAIHSRWPARRSPRATVLNPYKSVVVQLKSNRPVKGKEG